MVAGVAPGIVVAASARSRGLHILVAASAAPAPAPAPAPSARSRKRGRQQGCELGAAGVVPLPHEVSCLRVKALGQQGLGSGGQYTRQYLVLVGHYGPGVTLLLLSVPPAGGHPEGAFPCGQTGVGRSSGPGLQQPQQQHEQQQQALSWRVLAEGRPLPPGVPPAFGALGEPQGEWMDHGLGWLFAG